MKIKCPYCRKEMELKPNKALGKYVVCPFCSQTFRWTKEKGARKTAEADSLLHRLLSKRKPAGSA
jgi:uncharacterized Zn finger protein (UPF0148 family)